MIELVLGGARCGKSQYAEQQALSSGKKLIYIATAQAFDDEMRLRIAQHQQRRQQQWQTSEQALQLAETLSAFDDAENCILVDCLTLYLSNHLLNGTDSWQQEKPQLLTALQQMNADVILVMGANFGDLDNDGFLDFYLGQSKLLFLIPQLR